MTTIDISSSKMTTPARSGHCPAKCNHVREDPFSPCTLCSCPAILKTQPPRKPAEDKDLCENCKVLARDCAMTMFFPCCKLTTTSCTPHQTASQSRLSVIREVGTPIGSPHDSGYGSPMSVVDQDLPIFEPTQFTPVRQRSIIAPVMFFGRMKYNLRSCRVATEENESVPNEGSIGAKDRSLDDIYLDYVAASQGLKVRRATKRKAVKPRELWPGVRRRSIGSISCVSTPKKCKTTIEIVLGDDDVQ